MHRNVLAEKDNSFKFLNPLLKLQSCFSFFCPWTTFFTVRVCLHETTSPAFVLYALRFEHRVIWPGTWTLLKGSNYIAHPSNSVPQQPAGTKYSEAFTVAQKLSILPIFNTDFLYGVAKQPQNHSVRVGRTLGQNSEMTSKQRRPPTPLSVRRRHAHSPTPTFSPSATLNHLFGASPWR